MKIDDVYKLWATDKSKQVKYSTMCAYSLIYTNHIHPRIGNIEVEDIRKKDVQNFIDNELANGLSVKTVKDMIIVLKMIVNYAASELEFNINTTWKLYWPTKNLTKQELPPVYSNSEFKKIVNTCITYPSAINLGILLTICSGMRIGEVCALQFKDIDIDKKILTVNKTIERVYSVHDGVRKTELIISEPKTASSHREIPIISDAFSLTKKFYNVANPDYYVCSLTEKPIEPRVFRNHYAKFIKEKCKLNHVIRFHGLRHTFASLLIENKVDVKTVASILGHSDISTTLNTYVHPSELSKRKSMTSSIKKILK